MHATIPQQEENAAPRLKTHYDVVGLDKLVQQFGYTNKMAAPRLAKIVVSMTSKDLVATPKIIDGMLDELMLITGQKPVVTRAKKSISSFKLREGMAIGCKVTLRRAIMYHFLDRFVNIALPRVRDFRGFRAKMFDGQGNFSAGLQEQIVFPEIDYDKVDKIRGLNIALVTTAKTDLEGKALLSVFDIPFID